MEIHNITTSSPVVRKVNTAGIISTFAGNGTQGNSGDGGAATSAEIYDAGQLAIDGSGNIYFVDAGNSNVRKVTISTGKISTVAGTGTAGFSGDGGQATAAKLNIPDGLAFDGSGNLFIGEGYNYRVREVNTSGVINTVAGTGTGSFSGDGGSPTSATMQRIYAVLFDSDGSSYYIADGQNNVVRKISGICPANGGANKTAINAGSCCPEVPANIGTPAVSGMNYTWTPSTNLTSTNTATTSSTWTNTSTPQIYTVTVSYSLCATSTSTVQVSAHAFSGFSCCRLAAIEGFTTPANFSVYPNPSSNQVTISLYDKADYIQLIDMQGRLVFETKDIDAGDFKLDISKYNSGIYFIRAKIGDTIEKQKLVVE